MGVVEVNVVDSQPRQRLVEGLVDVLFVGPNDPIGISVGKTELCREEDLVALPAPLEPMQQKGEQKRKGTDEQRQIDIKPRVCAPFRD